MSSITQILSDLQSGSNRCLYTSYGWARTCRTSGTVLGFCNLNDGSNPEGLQIVLSNKIMKESNIEHFFQNVNTGTFLNCTGRMVNSPAKGQQYEMQLHQYEIIGGVDSSYPLSKNRINLETLRNYYHLRARTSTFGSIFRIRSSLMKILHDFFHSLGYLHLDPNILTINECEGGAGAFQVTENNISRPSRLLLQQNSDQYDWSSDHFNRPVYLTVSSQLQLEAMACALGNVYTINKKFSE